MRKKLEWIIKKEGKYPSEIYENVVKKQKQECQDSVIREIKNHIKVLSELHKTFKSNKI